MIKSIKALIIILLLGLGCWGFTQTEVLSKTVEEKRFLPTEKSPQALHREGTEYFKSQEYLLAIESLLAALKLDPNNFEAYNTLGMCFGELSEYNPALAAFERAIQLNADFVNAYYNRGHVHKRLGNNTSALADFARAIALSNNRHVSALIDRSSIYALQGEERLAIADLDRAIELNPDEGAAYYNRALVQLDAGDSPKLHSRL